MYESTTVYDMSSFSKDIIFFEPFLYIHEKKNFFLNNIMGIIVKYFRCLYIYFVIVIIMRIYVYIVMCNYLCVYIVMRDYLCLFLINV